jgi:uncharacterized caspase-like protein
VPSQRNEDMEAQAGAPSERMLRPAEAAEPESLLKPEYDQSWALVIGINTYFEAGMLTGRARQALTAGTAKQTVADRGPGGHSLFTSFVLQGLEGEAARRTPTSSPPLT